MATFNVQGRVLSSTTNQGIAMAKVQVFAEGRTNAVGEGTTDTTGRYNFDFPWSLDVSIPANRPDVHFRVTQRIDGADRIILNENPATQTRRNIADILQATLRTEGGLSLVSPPSGRPYDSLFVFTRVGVIGVNRIDTVGPGASGYADPDVTAAAPNTPDANSPFGSTLDIAAWFGAFADVSRYKIQYSSDGLTWNDITDPLSNSYLEFGIGVGGSNWVTQSMGPINEGGQTNLYKLAYVERPGQPWIFPDLIARWDTTKVPNGLYTLRMQGFKPNSAGTALIPSVTLIVDASFGELKLRIDNSPLVCQIRQIRFGPDATHLALVQPCDIVRLNTETLRIDFEASDAQGHLRDYNLRAMFGHNQTVTPQPLLPNKAADDYSAHVDATRHWNGGTIAIEYDGRPVGTRTVYTPALLPTCAYQFRLGATKRTTNGYGKIYSAEDTMHITIQRPPF